MNWKLSRNILVEIDRLEMVRKTLDWNYICNYQGRSLKYIHFEDTKEYHIEDTKEYHNFD